MGHAATVVAEYELLLWRTEELVREFQPQLSAGTVIRAVTSCRAELRRAGVRRGLARATEERARTRLQERAATASGASHQRPGRTPSGAVALPAPRLPGSGTAEPRAAIGQGSTGSALVGHSRSRAPSTAACSANR